MASNKRSVPRPSTSPCTIGESRHYLQRVEKGGPTNSVLGHVEGNLDMRLSSQVVHLSGLDRRHDVDQVGGIGQIWKQTMIT